jgi:hypothetical protein
VHCWWRRATFLIAATSASDQDGVLAPEALTARRSAFKASTVSRYTSVPGVDISDTAIARSVVPGAGPALQVPVLHVSAPVHEAPALLEALGGAGELVPAAQGADGDVQLDGEVLDRDELPPARPAPLDHLHKVGIAEIASHSHHALEVILAGHARVTLFQSRGSNGSR